MNIFFQFERKPLLFAHPQRLICCYHPQELLQSFEEVEYWLRQGFYVAGFVSYEAGYCFERCFLARQPQDFPLLCFGVYRAPEARRLSDRQKPFTLRHLRLSRSFFEYERDIQNIRQHIFDGDVYQITYCLKLFCDFYGDAQSLFWQLFKTQPVPYPAYIETERFRIASLSPERFLKKKGSFILTEPMKGTWPREKNALADVSARFRLKRDEKNKAENIMIADLLRNDLGRVARHIRAPKLLTVTGYETLFQMTSTVTGLIDPQISVSEVFAALFPSGSVTGAPRIRAMQIIRDLEPCKRKIYTGAMGYIAPTRDCYFNIPIRTLLIEGHRAEMGIGGGIVWDSTPQGEWNEGMLKAQFLTRHIKKE